MKIQKAIKSGKMFRREVWHEDDWINCVNRFGLTNEDVLADDWIIKKEWAELWGSSLINQVNSLLHQGKKLKFRYYSEGFHETEFWLDKEKNRIELSNRKIFNNCLDFNEDAILLRYLFSGEGEWYIEV